MGTLAALLKHRGHEVSGSDEHVYPPMSDFLAAEGIVIREGYDPAHVAGAIDMVVVGNAISRGNAELEAVLDRKLRYASLPEMVREQFLWNARSIVIAGTHGKTTTTALAGWLLTHGGADPTVLVGGIARNFGRDGSSYRVGQGRAFVIEGDEYDSAYFDKTAKFLKYLPDIAVVNNIEFDHADIYGNLDEVRLAFKRFVNLVPRQGLTLLGADSPDAAALTGQVRSRVETFGLAADAAWRGVPADRESGVGPASARVDAAELRRGLAEAASGREGGSRESAGAGTRFELFHRQKPIGTFEVPLIGDHNVRNAIAAVAVGVECGVPIDTLREGLREFKGVKRRLEVVGVKREVTIYDDFAHHPTAVAETLRAVRAAHPDRRIWAVFEPRSASSCRRVFQEDFARAFSGADEVVVASVFRSSLPEAERLSEGQLIEDLKDAGVAARHLPSVEAIVSAVADEARAGDLVVVMSNGGFGGIHRRLLEALG
jgi:UDP-N-acetylmuramate: L-alanyl-gamma-D-glutamyl-meso-diaminopimelate ligase